MPILNYTTTISPHKTVAELQNILAKAGALSVNTEFDKGEPTAVTFLVKVHDTYVNFRLPCNHEGVYNRLRRDPAVPRKLKTEEQARRVGWRIVKDWVEAQMAIIDAQLASLPEVFLPYAVAPSGRTFYQEFESSRLLANPEVTNEP